MDERAATVSGAAYVRMSHLPALLTCVKGKSLRGASSPAKRYCRYCPHVQFRHIMVRQWLYPEANAYPSFQPHYYFPHGSVLVLWKIVRCSTRGSESYASSSKSTPIDRVPKSQTLFSLLRSRLDTVTLNATRIAIWLALDIGLAGR